MAKQNLELSALKLSPVQAWNEWFLLACGDFAGGDFNAMTVSWGSMGVMWGKPFIQVVVRPTRYTYEFIEKYNTFTLSKFSADHHKALALLGSKSGRDGDKITEAGLTPCVSSQVASPSFEEAELTFECSKIYVDDLNPGGFKVPDIAKNYNNDYHRIYYGEIISVVGTEDFSN